MKTVVSSLFFVACVTLAYGFSQPIIRDTKAEGTVGDRTGAHCFWQEENVRIFPGESLNQPGKCRLLLCRDSFDIAITPCPFDMLNQFEWIEKDDTKLYPECCGKKVPKTQQQFTEN